MALRLFWAGVLVCLAAGSALAQDPTKIEPKHTGSISKTTECSTH